MTPSRLQALSVVAVLGALCAMTGDSCDWMEWEDPDDSVVVLGEKRACDLALAKTPDYDRGPCHVVTFDEHHGVVQVGRNYVCFLRAARWFPVIWDGVTPQDCPLSPPVERERIPSFSKELRVEEDWTWKTTQSRDSQLTTLVRTNVRAVAVLWRMGEKAPAECPADLIESEVEALDMNLAIPGARVPAWHYLTSDRIGVAFNADEFGAAYEVRVLRRDVEYLLLVDTTERRQPEGQGTGFVSGRIALADWKQQRVLCETTFELEQDPASPRELDAPVPYMNSFKEQVSGLLSEKVSVMSNQRLKLLKTW